MFYSTQDPERIIELISQHPVVSNGAFDPRGSRQVDAQVHPFGSLLAEINTRCSDRCMGTYMKSAGIWRR